MRHRWLTVLLPLAAAGCGYNTIQRLDERAAATQREIEVQLQRRADLVPNLVATVKGYAQHEETVFTNVANARSRLAGAIQASDPQQMAEANAQLTGALGRLIAIAENYPQLKADQSFLRLQDELAGTENRVARARSDYNEAARDYNSYIRQFPQTLTAKVTGAKTRGYYDAPAGVEQAPTVDFSRPGTGSSGNPSGAAAQPARP